MPPTRSASQSGKKNTDTPPKTTPIPPGSRPKRVVKPTTKELPIEQALPKPKITRKAPKKSVPKALAKPDSPNTSKTLAEVTIPVEEPKPPPPPPPINIICNYTTKLDGVLVYHDSSSFNAHDSTDMYLRIQDDSGREMKEYIERKYPDQAPDCPTYWTMLYGAEKRRDSKRIKVIRGSVSLDWNNAMGIVIIKSRSGCHSIDVNVGYCLHYPPGYEPPPAPTAATKAKGVKEVSHILGASLALPPPSDTVDHLAERHRLATQQVAPQSRTSATSKALEQLHQRHQQQQYTWEGYAEKLFHHWQCDQRDCVRFRSAQACWRQSRDIPHAFHYELRDQEKRLWAIELERGVPNVTIDRPSYDIRMRIKAYTEKRVRDERSEAWGSQSRPTKQRKSGLQPPYSLHEMYTEENTIARTGHTREYTTATERSMHPDYEIPNYGRQNIHSMLPDPAVSYNPRSESYGKSYTNSPVPTSTSFYSHELQLSRAPSITSFGGILPRESIEEDELVLPRQSTTVIQPDAFSNYDAIRNSSPLKESSPIPSNVSITTALNDLKEYCMNNLRGELRGELGDFFTTAQEDRWSVNVLRRMQRPVARDAGLPFGVLRAIQGIMPTWHQDFITRIAVNDGATALIDLAQLEEEIQEEEDDTLEVTDDEDEFEDAVPGEKEYIDIEG